MSKLPKKKIIGITGSMGSGKSQVSSIVSSQYPVLDCDRVNAHLLERGQKGYRSLCDLQLVVLNSKGEIDKAELAGRMFQDVQLKKQVESILHPLIFEAMQEWIDAQDTNVVFIEMPILFEVQAQHFFDEIWCVVVHQETALERLSTYRQVSREDALARLANQMSPSYKQEQSDVVIQNDGTMEQLEKKVLQLLREMKE